jgi:hypothetical protein
MAENILRTIQFKRNHNAWANAELAKQTVTNMASDLKNGEMVLGSYSDEKAVNGIAVVLALKANNQLFFVDNQTILNKLGILNDGSEDPNAANDSFVKKIEASDELIDAIIEAVGLNADGSYSPDASDPFISGATSLKDATTKLSQEAKKIEDFIGMSEDTSGKSLVEKVDEISGKSVTEVESTPSVTLTMGDSDDGTKKVKADVNVSSQEGNIILIENDGIFTQVDYNSATNSLVINGVEKQLNAGSIIDSITYNSETEELVITYHTSSSAEPVIVRVPLKDLIEEYDFQAATSDYNVNFTVERNVSGATIVKADVTSFDCGEY